MSAPLKMRIGSYVFDRVDYDDEHDVLRLGIGEPEPDEGEETPEGHVIHYAAGTQRVVGLTIISPRWHRARAGRLVVTLPETVEADPEELAVILTPA